MSFIHHNPFLDLHIISIGHHYRSQKTPPIIKPSTIIDSNSSEQSYQPQCSTIPPSSNLQDEVNMKANQSPYTKSYDQDQYLNHSTPHLPLKLSTPVIPASAFEHAAIQIPMLVETSLPDPAMVPPPPSSIAVHTDYDPYYTDKPFQCLGMDCGLLVTILSLCSIAATLLVPAIAVLVIRQRRKRRAVTDGTGDTENAQGNGSGLGGLDGAGDEGVPLRVMDPIHVGQEFFGMGM